MMSGSFYTELDSKEDEIRLIRLYPRQRDSVIKCELFSASIHHLPPYEALSYAWGHSRRNNYSIQLNGCTVAVTDNLYRALCRLQPPSDTRLLWVDQLCIDQSNNDERGQQVKLMGPIYSRSYQTLLWLGEEAWVDPLDVPDDQMKVPKTRPCAWTWRKEDDEVNLGACSCRPLVNAEVDLHGQSEDEKDYVYLAFSFVAELASLKSFDAIPYISSDRTVVRDVLRALWFIMHRPWWDRVWTVQECLLPPKSVLIYGPVTAPFEMFLSAASSYINLSMSARSELSQGLSLANATVLRHFSLTLTYIDIYRRRQLSGHKIDLVSVLRTFRIRKATDDRDKVYGLLGLDIDWLGQEPLYPNYHSGTPQVYRDITFKLIQGTQSLKILINNLENQDIIKKTDAESKPNALVLPSLVSSELQGLLQQIESWKTELKNEPYFTDIDGASFRLPSWVPDWSSSTNFEILSRFDQAELYSAARVTTTSPAMLIDESILALKGLKVDAVRWSSRIMAYTGGEDRSSVFEDWRAFAADATAYSSTSVVKTRASSNTSELSPLEDVFWRTLCGDTVAGSNSNSPIPTFHRTTPQNHEDFLDWCKAREPGLLPPMTKLLPDGTKMSSQSTMPVADVLGNIRNAMEPAIRAATTMRRLFVTWKGYLGLGPPETVGGEEIFVLHGERHPFAAEK